MPALPTRTPVIPASPQPAPPAAPRSGRKNVMSALLNRKPVLWFLFLFNAAVAIAAGAAGSHLHVHGHSLARLPAGHDRRRHGHRRARGRRRPVPAPPQAGLTHTPAATRKGRVPMPTMKSVQTAVPGTVEVAEIERPVPGPRDVLVRVRACGICGTDAAFVQMGGMPRARKGRRRRSLSGTSQPARSRKPTTPAPDRSGLLPYPRSDPETSTRPQIFRWTTPRPARSSNVRRPNETTGTAMRKRLIFTGVLGVAIASLAACGSVESTGIPSANSSSVSANPGVGIGDGAPRTSASSASSFRGWRRGRPTSRSSATARPTARIWPPPESSRRPRGEALRLE